MDFKVGDKVRFLGEDGPPAGTTGVVIGEKDGLCRPLVEFDGWSGGHSGSGASLGSKCCWWVQPHEIELINGKAEENPVFCTGMKYKVIGNTCGHGIALGTVIELNGKSGDTRWWVRGAPGSIFIEERDLEAVNEEKTDKIAVKIGSKNDWDRVLKKCYETGSKFFSSEPKYESGYRFIYPKGELKNDFILCGHSGPKTVAHILSVEEFLGEKPVEKNSDFAVWCDTEDEWKKVNAKAIAAGKTWGKKEDKNHYPEFDGIPVVLYVRKSKQLGWDNVEAVGRTAPGIKIVMAAEYLGETAEKDPKRIVYCETCQKPFSLDQFTGSTHKWRELKPGELEAPYAGKPAQKDTPKTAPKHELIKTFGDTPTVLNYPPEPKKIIARDTIDAYHCPVCRCDRRVETHKLKCPNFDGRLLKGDFDIKAEKTVSGKPNEKEFTRWFHEFDKKLMT